MTPRVTLTRTCIASVEPAEQVSSDARAHTRAPIVGTRGFAFTLLTDKDKEFAGHLVQCLEHAGQLVANNLIDLAMQVCVHCTHSYKRRQTVGVVLKNAWRRHEKSTRQHRRPRTWLCRADYEIGDGTRAQLHHQTVGVSIAR